MSATTVQTERGPIPFELQLPAEWLKFEPYAPERPESAGLVLCARYGSPDQRVFVEVHAQRLAREVSSASWLEVWLAANGYAVEREERTRTPAGENADVVATRRNDEGELFTYRIASRKNADRVYLALGFARPIDFARASPVLSAVTRSFLPIGTPVPSAEPLVSVELARIDPGRVLHPQSWSSFADPSVGPSQECVGFKNVAPGGALGQIGVIVSAPSVHATHREAAEVLVRGARAAVPALEVPLLSPVELPGLVDARQGEVKRLVDGEMVRVRIVVGKRAASWTSLLLVGRCPQPDVHLVDAMNERAFEIAARSFA